MKILLVLSFLFSSVLYAEHLPAAHEVRNRTVESRGAMTSRCLQYLIKRIDREARAGSFSLAYQLNGDCDPAPSEYLIDQFLSKGYTVQIDNFTEYDSISVRVLYINWEDK